MEEKLTFQKKISGIIFYHHIPKESIVTLSKTPLSYVIPGKYTFDVNRVKTVFIKGVDDKCQITPRFPFSMSFSMKIIGTISENPWSNTEKTCENNCVLIIVRHNLTNKIPTTGYYLQ